MVTYRPVGTGGCECPDRHHEPPDCACARALVVAFGGVTGVASADGAAAAVVGAAVVGAAVVGAAVVGAAVVVVGAAAAALADDGTAGAAVVGAAAARDPAAVVAAADEVPAPPVESSELVDDVPVASS